MLLIGALLVAVAAIVLAARTLGAALAASDQEHFAQRQPEEA